MHFACSGPESLCSNALAVREVSDNHKAQNSWGSFPRVRSVNGRVR